jgi:hypothetical protein
MAPGHMIVGVHQNFTGMAFGIIKFIQTQIKQKKRVKVYIEMDMNFD